jgi:hypothetical protein
LAPPPVAPQLPADGCFDRRTLEKGGVHSAVLLDDVAEREGAKIGFGDQFLFD